MILTNQDLVLLSTLRRDGRQTLTNLSRETRIPVSTIYDKLKEYDNSLISKNTVLLDFNKLGYFTRATIAVRTLQKDREELREFLLKHRHVNSLYKINNGFDFMFDCIFTHMKELEEFMEEIEKKFRIRNKYIFYMIDEIKREEFFNCPEIIPIMRGK